ncbi:MAG: 4'-phosphopantetheinyl transferase superfamily protein [Parvularculaceae bacterium]
MSGSFSVQASFARLSPEFCADDEAGLLTSEERRTADRFYFSHDRDAYVAAHALLHMALRAVTGRSNCSVCYDDMGKPVACCDGVGLPVSVSLSHTRGMAACAVSSNGNVGIDVEAVRQEVAFEDLARRYFSQSEHAQIEAADETARRELFFRTWTLKEAVVKALGKGLRIALNEFDVLADPSTVRFNPSMKEEGQHWLIESRCLSGYFASAALRQSDQACALAEIDWNEIKFLSRAPEHARSWRVA